MGKRASFGTAPLTTNAQRRGRAPLMASGRVVVGVDGSKTARQALAWALDEARRRGVPLHVVEALDFTSVGDVASSLTAKGREEELAERERFLDTLIAEFGDHGVDVTTELVLGGPGPELIAAVGADDLLVVGATGHGVVARAVLGSVSDWVTRHAPCPVVVIPNA
jgi:nucleotide-binding universal stress UspA family protein